MFGPITTVGGAPIHLHFADRATETRLTFNYTTSAFQAILRDFAQQLAVEPSQPLHAYIEGDKVVLLTEAEFQEASKTPTRAVVLGSMAAMLRVIYAKLSHDCAMCNADGCDDRKEPFDEDVFYAELVGEQVAQG